MPVPSQKELPMCARDFVVRQFLCMSSLLLVEMICIKTIPPTSHPFSLLVVWWWSLPFYSDSLQSICPIPDFCLLWFLGHFFLHEVQSSLHGFLLVCLPAPLDRDLCVDVLVSLYTSFRAVLFRSSQGLITACGLMTSTSLFTASCFLWDCFSSPTMVAKYGCGANKVGNLFGVSCPGDVTAIHPVTWACHSVQAFQRLHLLLPSQPACFLPVSP